MTASPPVAVIGAGPAGATLARILAEAGREVLLIDERGPYEKPCGGGVTLRGWGERPLLRDGPCAVVREAVAECGDDRVRLDLPEPVRIYRRIDLNRALFDAAIEAGARWIRARAAAVAGAPGAMRVSLADGTEVEASFVAGADGAAGVSRKLLGGGRGRRRHILALGFHGKRREGDDVLYLRFPPEVPGYAWIFPRPDHVSAGICCRDPRMRPPALEAALRRALDESGRAPEPIPGSEVSFPIPDFGEFDGPRAGPGWALIGDAGAFVDPITLEGISHAVRSAEVLAAQLLAGRPERFESAWRADPFGRELIRSAGMVRSFYAPGFTGRMVRVSAACPRVGRVLGGLLAGTVPYRGLRRRVTMAMLADRAGALIRGRS